MHTTDGTIDGSIEVVGTEETDGSIDGANDADGSRDMLGAVVGSHDLSEPLEDPLLDDEALLEVCWNNIGRSGE